jgi:hypothetical protein
MDYAWVVRYDRTILNIVDEWLMVKSSADCSDQDSPWKLILRQYFPEAMVYDRP